MKAWPKKWIIIFAVAIMVCWVLPLYTISSPVSGGGYVIETTLGCQLKTGFIRMRDGSLMFSPGLLIPISSALCILFASIYKRATWFTIATAATAGLLAVMQGGFVLITFYRPSFGAHLFVATGAIMLFLALGLLRRIRGGGREKRLIARID
jgi:hypothetical protein